MTRITADTASALVRRGIPATVMYPAVDWWDFKCFAASRASGWSARKARAVLGFERFGASFRRRPWIGRARHTVDPRVRTQEYGITPSAQGWGPEEITIVHPPYLIPHLLRTLPHEGIKLIGALHMNLERAMASASPITRAWYRHWVARERLIDIPRYTTSLASKEAAERLGIPVHRVIHDGCVDLDLFRPAPRRNGAPLQVLLYCETNLQKGQGVGVEALTPLRATHPEIRLSSVGNVLPRHEKLFHRNYGYLHGESLVRAIQESDIFVYPSLYDGFPAPPLQAMACGTALVTTRVEGVEEYALHEANALLCLPGDSAQLRGQVIRLAQEPQLRQRLQAKAVEAARAFGLERGIGELLDFLQVVYEGWSTHGWGKERHDDRRAPASS